MSLAGASGVASPSNKMQSIGSNIAGPTTSNENNGAVAATSEPTQVRYLNIIDQAMHFQIKSMYMHHKVSLDDVLISGFCNATSSDELCKELLRRVHGKRSCSTTPKTTKTQ